MPVRTVRTPLRHFAAVHRESTLLRCSKSSSELGGAMGIRTPDLLHAIQWHHVHRSTPVQVTVPERPHESAQIRICCGTSCCTNPGQALPTRIARCSQECSLRTGRTRTARHSHRRSHQARNRRPGHLRELVYDRSAIRGSPRSCPDSPSTRLTCGPGRSQDRHQQAPEQQAVTGGARLLLRRA